MRTPSFLRLKLELPVHFRITRGEGRRIDENEAVEFASFANAITSVEHTHDFVVIDTPGADTYLTRLAHSMADTLITPFNDSFVDFEVLSRAPAPAIIRRWCAAPAAPHRRLVEMAVFSSITIRNPFGRPTLCRAVKAPLFVV